MPLDMVLMLMLIEFYSNPFWIDIMNLNCFVFCVLW